MKKLSLNDPLFAPMTNESLRQFKGGMATETNETTWSYSQTHDRSKDGCTDTRNDGTTDGRVILDVTSYDCEGDC